MIVFLPGSPEQPRSARAAAALPLYPGGRLTLTRALRDQAGIADRSDVLALLDPERLTVTVTAASRVDVALRAALDALRATTSDVGVLDTAEQQRVVEPGTAAPAARLRIVG